MQSVHDRCPRCRQSELRALLPCGAWLSVLRHPWSTLPQCSCQSVHTTSPEVPVHTPDLNLAVLGALIPCIEASGVREGFQDLLDN